MQPYIECAINLQKTFRETIIEMFPDSDSDLDFINWIADEGSKQCAIQLITDIIENKQFLTKEIF